MRPAILLACLFAAALPAFAVSAPPAADALLAAAKTEAAADHKNILIAFSASWCGPCRQFEGFLADPAIHPILVKSFVPLRLAVGEEIGHKPERNTPGAQQLKESFGGKDAGFPFLIMLTPDAQPIADSFRPVPNKKTGDNIGYPATPAEIDWFMTMLSRAAPTLTLAETATIRTWLLKHGRP